MYSISATGAHPFADPDAASSIRYPNQDKNSPTAHADGHACLAGSNSYRNTASSHSNANGNVTASRCNPNAPTHANPGALARTYRALCEEPGRNAR